MLFQGFPHFGSGEGGGHHKVSQIGVEFQGQLNGFLHRLFGFARHTKNEEAHRLQLGLLGPPKCLFDHFNRLTFFDDVAQHPVITIFYTKTSPLATGLLHELKQLRVGIVDFHAVDSDPGDMIQVGFNQSST